VPRVETHLHSLLLALIYSGCTHRQCLRVLRVLRVLRGLGSGWWLICVPSSRLIWFRLFYRQDFPGLGLGSGCQLSCIPFSPSHRLRCLLTKLKRRTYISPLKDLRLAAIHSLLCHSLRPCRVLGKVFALIRARALFTEAQAS
jgi:hypothetical protein